MLAAKITDEQSPEDRGAGATFAPAAPRTFAAGSP
jgi:hypothetical protein